METMVAIADVSPLDEYKGMRRELERKLSSLVSYREWCHKRAVAATNELDEVESAISELETLLKLGSKPEVRT